MLILTGVLTAFVAGLLANWLVSELMPSPEEQATKAANIAVAVARRAETWALVGAALAIWLALAQRGGRNAVGGAIAGLLVGALAGAFGGVIDALPDIASREFGSWIDPAALAATGALIGALIGGSWTPRHTAYGFVAGGASGLLGQMIMSSPPNPGAAAVRVALICGLIVGVLGAIDAARETAPRSRTAGPNLPPHTP